MSISNTRPLTDQIRGNFSAVIFDCDGTLADTMSLHYRAWRETLAGCGAEFPEALFYEWGGVPTARIVELLNERFGYLLAVSETADAKERLYEEFLPQARPIEPVVELVHAYHGRYPLAVASGGLRRLVEKTLLGLGLRRLFTAVCTAEDVERGKPHPDLFLLTAGRLGVDPLECVVFEDSDLGLEAASRAGMQSVDIRLVIPGYQGRSAGS